MSSLNMTQPQNSAPVVSTTPSTPPPPMTAPMAPVGENEHDEGPKTPIDVILGDEKNIEVLVNRINYIIKKKGMTLVNPGESSSYPLFDFRFPADSKTKMESLILCYDAETAYRAIVEFNSLNRPVRVKKVLEYTIYQLTGSWREKSPQGIAFTWAPQSLLDGQHRLLAIYLASKIMPNIRVPLLTWFNCDPALREVLDNGVNRTFADKAVMTLKSQGLVFENDQYRGISAKMGGAAVCARPSLSGMKEEDKRKVFEENIDLVTDILLVLKETRGGVRYSSAWAGVFVDAAFFFGREAILPLAKRFARNEWHQYENDRVDPLANLHERLVNNINAHQMNKMSTPAVASCTIYAIRKALMAVSVPGKNGARHQAQYNRFFKEEAEDFRAHGKDSKVLAKYSIARQKGRHVEEPQDAE